MNTPADRTNYHLNSPIQGLVAEAFNSRRKAIGYGSTGKIRIIRHPEPTGEVEVWYSHGETDPYEITLWVLPDGAAVFEARCLNRKKLGQKLYDTRFGLLQVATRISTTPSTEVVRQIVSLVVDAYENSISAFILRASDTELAGRLAGIWDGVARSTR